FGHLPLLKRLATAILFVDVSGVAWRAARIDFLSIWKEVNSSHPAYPRGPGCSPRSMRSGQMAKRPFCRGRSPFGRLRGGTWADRPSLDRIDMIFHTGLPQLSPALCHSFTPDFA